VELVLIYLILVITSIVDFEKYEDYN